LSGKQAPPSRTLRNDRVGYSLSYPRSWKITGKVAATQFAAGARCRSVRVVDFSAGPAATVRQSFVQVCWKRAAGLSLDAFMRKTYGGRLADLFERTRLGGVPAYRTRGPRMSRTFFLQTHAYRLQVVATIVAAPAERTKRLAQVNRILASFSVTG
jgi:hypothetical protein